MRPRARRRRHGRAAALLAGAVLVLTAVQPLWLLDLVARAAPGIVWRVESERPLAALSFDDGPHPVWTPQVLDILAREQVRATFFLIGRHARNHPALVARIRAEGHEVGNHTDTHRRPLFQSGAAFEADLLRAEAALGLEGAGWKLYRPPAGWIRPAQRERAARHGYLCVLGSAYAYDPYRPPAAYIRWVVAKNLRPGAIVVLHDAGGNRSRTVAALPGILQAARAKGLRFVAVSDLLRGRER